MDDSIRPAICVIRAWCKTPTLPVTPAQLKRPGIGRNAHWVIVLHLGFEGCSQPRELWFVDILMCYVNIIFRFQIQFTACVIYILRDLSLASLYNISVTLWIKDAPIHNIVVFASGKAGKWNPVPSPPTTCTCALGSTVHCTFNTFK